MIPESFQQLLEDGEVREARRWGKCDPEVTIIMVVMSPVVCYFLSFLIASIKAILVIDMLESWGLDYELFENFTDYWLIDHCESFLIIADHC